MTWSVYVSKKGRGLSYQSGLRRMRMKLLCWCSSEIQAPEPRDMRRVSKVSASTGITSGNGLPISRLNSGAQGKARFMTKVFLSGVETDVTGASGLIELTRNWRLALPAAQ